MSQALLITDDRALAQLVGLACLERGVTVRVVDTICEGVRCLTEMQVSAILADAACLRLWQAEQVRLFDRVAPGVQVIMLVSDTTSAADRIELELLGCSVLPKPVDIEGLIRKVEMLQPEYLGDRGGLQEVS